MRNNISEPTAWMIGNDGSAVPVICHVYGSEDDLDENMSAACFLYKYADTDMLRHTLTGCFYVWASAKVCRYFENREIQVKYDWNEVLKCVVGDLPYKVLDWDVTIDDVLCISGIVKSSSTGAEEWIALSSAMARFKEKYTDYTGQEVNRELNQMFMRARFGGRYNTKPTCKDMFFRISSVGFNWFNIIKDFVLQNKDKLGIETVTIIRDYEGIGSEEFYSNKNGAKFNKMSIDVFMTENYAENEHAKLEAAQQTKEEIKAEEILQKLAKGHSFESELKRVRVTQSAFREWFDDLIYEVKQLENSNPQFMRFGVNDMKVVYESE